MKKFMVSGIVFAILLFFAGCEASPSSEGSSVFSEETVSETMTEATAGTSMDEEPEASAAETAEESFFLDDDRYRLIGAYLNEENEVCVDLSSMPTPENYDLFRKYLFGVWDSRDGYLPWSMTLDDSENIDFAGRGYFREFYQPSDRVIMFTLHTNADAYVLWLDMDDPDVAYIAVCYVTNELYNFTCQGITAEVHTLTKSDAAPSEPADGFLSIFKLHEMANEHRVDFDLLTVIDYGIIDGTRYLHNATYDFYPMVLVSESDDKIVIRTSVGNAMYDDLKPIDVVCTFDRAGAATWVRTARAEETADPPSLSDPGEEAANDPGETAASPEEDKPIFASEEDKAAFELLGDYTAEHSTYPRRHVELHINDERWEQSEDYELFRKYFFGSWGKILSDGTPLIIDDSESAFLAEYCHMHYFMGFYKVSEDVLAFQTGSAAGGSLYWLDKNEPNILYNTEGTPGDIFWGEDGFPYVWTLPKNDTAPNEPENNYLSVYRLREMAQKHGIDYRLLVEIQLGVIPWSGHNDSSHFYPMYLVSEADDRIEIVTRAGDVYSVACDTRIILQKIDGEWVRTVEVDEESARE